MGLRCYFCYFCGAHAGVVNVAGLAAGSSQRPRWHGRGCVGADAVGRIQEAIRPPRRQRTPTRGENRPRMKQRYGSIVLRLSILSLRHTHPAYNHAHSPAPPPFLPKHKSRQTLLRHHHYKPAASFSAAGGLTIASTTAMSRSCTVSTGRAAFSKTPLRSTRAKPS
jgi:hypothetical protein